MMYTRDQLIKAMEKYNTEFLENPDDFEDISHEPFCAKNQVDKLLSFINN